MGIVQNLYYMKMYRCFGEGGVFADVGFSKYYLLYLNCLLYLYCLLILIPVCLCPMALSTMFFFPCQDNNQFVVYKTKPHYGQFVVNVLGCRHKPIRHTRVCHPVTSRHIYRARTSLILQDLLAYPVD